MLIENFRPGLMAELGLALDDLRAANPSPGHLLAHRVRRRRPPETAARPGYDIIVQALCGLMSVTGEPGGEPVKAGVALLDVVTGSTAAIGILAALPSGSEPASAATSASRSSMPAWPRW